MTIKTIAFDEVKRKLDYLKAPKKLEIVDKPIFSAPKNFVLDNSDTESQYELNEDF